MKKKFKLSELNVQSFVTNVEMETLMGAGSLTNCCTGNYRTLIGPCDTVQPCIENDVASIFPNTPLCTTGTV